MLFTKSTLFFGSHIQRVELKNEFFVSKIHFTSKGSAFVLNKETNENYFISKMDTLNALNEDIVLCEKIKDCGYKKKAEAKRKWLSKNEVLQDDRCK